ncbi:amidohydrolase [Aspergillus ruber CBS 135680]|uniref:Amidohydrolase 3 n=1 Tax=Aspergillus ruber (strain CBS 135680) TaxID=1388766 RepID=A0A017SNA4_ASPRC|nr:amidohydrolase 3 [Aspergillus ruber CBS 135680]EYE98437.1 amidohydrolase 3 [Aspergillus ruber CBS 135680]
MTTTIFTNARIFTGSGSDTFQQAMIILGHQILHVGSGDDSAVLRAKLSGAHEIDLNNHIVVPGFVDSHVHILDFALSQRRLNLLSCKSLVDIREMIKTYAQKHSELERIVCKGWVQSSTGGVALANMLNDLDERPIYIQANDLHSIWCNTAALHELSAENMSNPPGGTIHRDENGKPSGLLSESAHLNVALPFLTSMVSIEEKFAALEDAVKAYTTAGYTGMIDMAMNEKDWEILKLFHQRHADGLPFHVAAHWLVPYSEDMDVVFKHVDRAIALHQEFHPATSPTFCIAGIKLIADGVVDGCTAALSQPYTNTTDPVAPIWPTEALKVVIRKATAAGLQCAVHAIGDAAVKQAIDALSASSKAQPSIPPRHRIEHLELTSPEDAKRLGQLGITASVQPVHSDPVLFRAWPSLIGQHRCGRAFAYQEFLEGGAKIAFGTDAPTAAHLALPNLYSATTRKSAIEPDSEETVNKHFGLELAKAVEAATTGAAYSRFAEGWTGSLRKGLSADFVVLDTDWRAEGLLQAKVTQTWYRGVCRSI